MTEATPGREAALAWLKHNFQMGVTSSLPRNEDGEVIWELAGPMMQREWPAMKFAVIYLTGLDEQMAETLAARVLNEWHGLKPDAGLEDIGPDDLSLEDPVQDKRLVKFAILGAVLIALAWLVVWVTI